MPVFCPYALYFSFQCQPQAWLRADATLDSCHGTRVSEKALLHTVLLTGESLANYLSFIIGAGQDSGREIKFVEQNNNRTGEVMPITMKRGPAILIESNRPVTFWSLIPYARITKLAI